MRVVRLISRGGFGRVEEVQLSDGSRAARKVFDPATVYSEADNDKFRKRFRREVGVQSKLPDAIALPILSCNLDEDPPSFVMPLADCTLRDKIEADRVAGKIDPVPLADVLSALEEIHRIGLVHRDLKPENVLLHDNRWKLSDFGLVLIGDSSTARLTSLSSAWGSPAYCAPEQATGFRSVSPEADIYSFGCILHDIAAGGARIPFHRYTAPGVLGAIIEKCTETVPHRRFRSIRVLRESLLQALSAPVAVPQDRELKEWLERLGTASGWETSDLEEFARFVHRHGAKGEESEALHRGLDESILKAFHALDAQLCAGIAESYCAWAHGGFSFGYCDVVAARLEAIYELGDISLKAIAAFSAIELGYSHNRWYVMRVALRMCDGSISDDLASRIALEIRVAETKYKFRRCAEGIGLSIDSFHPRIAAELAQKGPATPFGG